MNVLIIDPFPKSLLNSLQSLPLTLGYHPEVAPEEVPALLAGQQVLLLNSKVRVDEALAANAPELRLVIRAGVGMDHIAVEALAARGIRAVNTPGANAVAVAEQAMGMLLSLRHWVLRANRQVKQFEWKRAENRGHEIHGKTVGIIGYGHTGSAFGERLRGFGCRVLAYDKYKTAFGTDWVEEASMEQLFAEAEIISLHVPLTTETHALVDEAFLERFRHPITLLNLARGPVVKLEALLRGLDDGTVIGAALDVLENEQLHTLTPRQQALYENLFSRENVILTPHIGGWSFESRENIGRAVIDHIQALLQTNT